MTTMMDEGEATTNLIAEEECPVDIYFCTIRNAGECNWYVIKHNTRPNTYQSLSPVFPDLHPYHSSLFNSTNCVALGSVLYVLGGHMIDKKSKLISVDGCSDPPDPARDVYSINTLHPDRGWTRYPPMTIARTSAQVFTLQGKIYVLGGFAVPPSDNGGWPNRDDDIKYYAEVFDPSEEPRCWRPALLTIPDDIKGYRFIDAHQLCVNKASGEVELLARIVDTGYKQSLYKYNFLHGLWSLYADDFGPYRSMSPVFSHDILYSYGNYPACDFDQERSQDYMLDMGSILCFDSKIPRAKPKKLTFSDEKHLDLFPQPSHLESYPPATLLHLGTHLGKEKFCLLWVEEYDFTGPKGEDRLVIACLKFTVSVVPSPSPSGDEQKVDFFGSRASMSTYCVNGELLLNGIAIPHFNDKVEHMTVRRAPVARKR